jgi:hypothetical protein
MGPTVILVIQELTVVELHLVILDLRVILVLQGMALMLVIQVTQEHQVILVILDPELWTEVLVIPVALDLLDRPVLLQPFLC